MPNNPGPTELQEIATRPFVAEDPMIVPALVQPAPVFLLLPAPRLARVPVINITDLTVEHPAIQLPKELGRNHRSIVVGPAPDDGIESVQNGLQRGALEASPDVCYLLSLVLDRLPARCDQQLEPQLPCLGG